LSRVDWELPGLAVAVVHGDEVIFAEGFGVKEVGREDPVDAHTLFQIGSVSKSFGAAAIGALVDDGPVQWDDPVVKHLPWFRVKDPGITREMTIRDLLSHQSGAATRTTRSRRSWPAPPTRCGPGTSPGFSDRGSPMTAKCTAQLMADMGIIQSLGRPRVSNDNPYSEAQFKKSSTIPASPGGSQTSKRRRSSAACFSSGTTRSTGTGASACLLPARSTSAAPPR